jgi:aspartate-semialdehyde dehydrogenase
MKRLKVGILGATGMVGQRFIALLHNHPWFEVVSVAASPRSAGKLYEEAVRDRWAMKELIPEDVKTLTVRSVEDEMSVVVQEVDFVFSALDLEKEEIRRIEEAYAAADVPVVSNNSAHRWTEDVPMIIPEVNEHHTDLIKLQQKKRGWNKGFIAVKPNCSIQSYVMVLNALTKWDPKDVHVTSLQAISGAGKTFETWPEMVDNVIPYIGGEEEKSEKEPMKIWGSVDTNTNSVVQVNKPTIAATCIRVPVTDGHMASVSVSFEEKPTKYEIIQAVQEYENPIVQYNLPSAPSPAITYYEEDDRPQTKLDRSLHTGMGVSMGRLRQDVFFDWRFIALSHNTVRGAAGGAVLVAELLKAKGFLAD